MACHMLRRAIELKSGKYSRAHRATMLLALDVGHVAALADRGVIDSYLRVWSDPADELGFYEVWAVGPTTRLCQRIAPAPPLNGKL